MRLTKQTVYLPVSDFNSSERAICTIGIPDLYGDKVVEQEAFVFTPEQLNEYTANVIKQVLATAANEATVTPINHEEISEGSFRPIWGIDNDSITNTFEETFKKFKI